MINEKSCGAIIFIKDNEKIKYLLLFRAPFQQYKALWDFPRGNVEENETEKQTAIREIKEETGLKEFNFLDFKEAIHFFYRRDNDLVSKNVTFFLAETAQEEVKISEEHNEFKWATFEEATTLLKKKDSKSVLTKANDFLKDKFKQKTLF